MCAACQKDFKASNIGWEEFLATHVPRRQTRPFTDHGQCRVEHDSVRCAKPATSNTLCNRHDGAWRSYRSKGQLSLSLAEWASQVARPYTDAAVCLITGCGVVGFHHRLCHAHYQRWRETSRRGEHAFTAAEWAARQGPYLGAVRFSLVPLPEPLRWEMLLGLQRRDRSAETICPMTVRTIVTKLAGECTSLLEPAVDEILRQPSKEWPRTVIRQLRWLVSNAFDEFNGVSPLSKDVLDLRAIGLKAYLSDRQIASGIADLRKIPQQWLRDLLRSWVDGERPNGGEFAPTFQAVVFAGQALNQRPGGGHDVTALEYADMSAVAAVFRNLARENGTPYSAAQRNRLYRRFCGLLDFGRSAGLLTTLSGNFARHHRSPAHRVDGVEANEEENGKALPGFVIRQLDAHLDSLGQDLTYGPLTRDDIQAMMRTAYVVLRDTGRRPGEVVSLHRDCVEIIDGSPSLLWDNHKSRRHRRRLPITQETTEVLMQWRQRRVQLDAPVISRAYLFPAINEKSTHPHMRPDRLAEAIRLWVRSLARLDSDVVGADGEPLPFDRSKVFPYAFRHSYAQRHADVGTPVDVLKELMDHDTVMTTMGYYRVSHQRKKQAVATLSAHVVDRAGNPAAPSSALAYERNSVAVPFGGCTEPSNVKAGGGACPIRFQCAGCGFYRPDPSYLPAIEQHMNELRADRETAEAMDAAEFVIRNLADQITSYQEVATKMRTRLEQLPDDERAEIESASAVLRKARAGGAHKLLPLTATNGESSQT